MGSFRLLVMEESNYVESVDQDVPLEEYHQTE